MAWWEYAIAVLGGFGAGVVNTLAGNGSVLTLGIMTELMGLPGTVANGTNRIGILVQSATSVYIFNKNKRFTWQQGWPIVAVMFAGAMLGLFIALRISNEQFRFVYKWLMLLMLLSILVKPKRWLRETDTQGRPSWWLLGPAFFLLGIYGGFIQMGMGIFFLALMVLGARYNIIEANAYKLLVVTLYTVVVLAVFAWQGLVDWRTGLIIASGQTLGALVTTRFAVKHPAAAVWTHRLLVFIIVAAVIKVFELHRYWPF